MTLLSYQIPELGNPSKTQDPRTATAFTTILSWANGGVGESNLEEALKTSLQLPSGTYRGKSIITTEETRSGTSFGLMATPDAVTVTLEENGRFEVSFQGMWSESVSGAAAAAVFLGAEQIKTAQTGVAAPVVTGAEASHGSTAGTMAPLSTWQGGLVGTGSGGTAYTGDVSTGQIFGSLGAEKFGVVKGFVKTAGSYTFSIRFKASSGTVTVKNRQLWVKAL